jgi:hypothetical protein
MAINEDELMILSNKVAKRMKKCTDEIKDLQIIAKRLQLVNTESPKDQWGEDIPNSEIEKHYNKAKSDFNKLTASEASAKDA